MRMVVEEKSAPGTFRLCIDGRPFNHYLLPSPVSYDSAQILSDNAHTSSCFFGFDLKQGYYCLNVAEEDRTFICMRFEGVTYRWVALPFGVSYAPQAFTALTRVIRDKCNAVGILMSHYLDDFGVVARDGATAVVHRAFLLLLLTRAGLAVGWSKCAPIHHTIEFLGYVISVAGGVSSISIPYRRIAQCASQAASLLACVTVVPCRTLASLTGRIMSMSTVLGRDAMLYTAEAFNALPSIDVSDGLAALRKLKTRWSSTTPITPELREEISYWHDRFTAVAANPPASPLAVVGDRIPFPHLEPPPPPHIIVAASDAGEHGIGGIIMHDEASIADLEAVTKRTTYTDPNIRARVHLDLRGTDQYASSTHRETVAAHRVLSTAAEHAEASPRPFRKGRAYLQVDSQALANGANKGRLTDITSHRLLVAVDKMLKSICCTLTLRWVGRLFNEPADVLSKHDLRDDFGLSACLFAQLDKTFSFTHDRYASAANVRLRIDGSALAYNSLFEGEGSLGPALSSSWTEASNFVHPPPHLSAQAYAKAQADKAKGVIILHVFPDQPWFRHVFAAGRPLRPAHPRRCTVLWIKHTLTPTRTGPCLRRRKHAFKQVQRKGIPISHVVALRFDFS